MRLVHRLVGPATQLGEKSKGMKLNFTQNIFTRALKQAYMRISIQNNNK